MKQTPLRAVHEKLGAKMVDFAGWNMPVQYDSIIAEHNAVRNACGIFDLSHMGEFWLNGPDAMVNLQCICTQDIEKLSDRQIAYSPMCKPDGTIVDDILVYRWDTSTFMLVVNASNTQKDYDWIKSNLEGIVELSDSSDRTGLIAIQGPKAEEVLQKITNQRLKAIKFYWFTLARIADCECVISRTGYTGEDGFEIYCDIENTEKIWELLMEAGKDAGIKPAGLGARDSLRLEARLLLYGNDIDDTITPMEANLGWTVKFAKGPFIGSKVLKEQKDNGTSKTLVGFEMPKGPAPRHGYIVKADGKEVGHVTSGLKSPTLGKNIGLTYVPPKYSEIGTKIQVVIRDKDYDAEIIETPFYKR
ncbi:MAG: glycine cleavage system aminomethyltransferase GcvT [Candidatus Riflebacteria bacterium]|nr:glycine cleavage system aminomethyltransferase GcvT [Candidatus Riflebacteria bacterium]